MNARQATLINLLLRTDHFIPTADLATDLGCSERTVRTDMYVVNSFLAQQDGIPARIESKRGNGLRIVCSEDARTRIVSAVRLRALEIDDDLDRFCSGIIALMLEPARFTIETLARTLFTNKQRLKDDLGTWETLMEPFGIRIVRNRALSVRGPEGAVRIFLVHHLSQLPPDRLRDRLGMRSEGAGDFAFLKAIASDLEQELRIPFTDNAREQIFLYLQISARRLCLGHGLEASAPSGWNEGAQRDTRGSRPDAPAITRACDRIAATLGVAVPPAERSMLRDIILVSTRRWTPELEHNWQPVERVRHISNALADGVADLVGSKLPTELEKPLAFLVNASMMHRAVGLSVSLPPENIRVARFEHMAMTMRIMRALLDNHALAEFRPFETDYTRIAMLLLGWAERDSRTDHWQVGLVVNCGIEQAYFARNRLERLVDELHVARILTEAEAMELSATDTGLDFLIGFMPIECEMPYVTIGEAVGVEDIARVTETLLRLGLPRLTSGGASIAPDNPAELLLPAENRISARDAIRQLLEERGIWRGQPGRFADIFEACSTEQSGWLVFTVHTADILRTSILFCELTGYVSFVGDRIERAAILAVSPADDLMVPQLASTFRRAMKKAGGADGSAPSGHSAGTLPA